MENILIDIDSYDEEQMKGLVQQIRQNNMEEVFLLFLLDKVSDTNIKSQNIQLILSEMKTTLKRIYGNFDTISSLEEEYDSTEKDLIIQELGRYRFLPCYINDTKALLRFLYRFENSVAIIFIQSILKDMQQFPFLVEDSGYESFVSMLPEYFTLQH